jgi:alkylation response protein AidB-like acyl-CoA dehydrogenase
MSRVDLVPHRPSAEQEELRAAVRGFARRAADAEAWRGLAAELGIGGLGVPEYMGGVGGGIADVAVVAEELGRVLAPVPFLSTALVGLVLGESGSAGRAHTALVGICAGSSAGAVALSGDFGITGGRLSGFAEHVVAGDAADVTLVRAGKHIYAVSMADAEVVPEPPLDQTRSLASLRFEKAPARQLRVGPGRAEDLFRVLISAECVGAARYCLEVTVTYLRARTAFGRPIGSFQAIKHRCADLEVEVTAAAAAAAAAVGAAQRSSTDLGMLALIASTWCSRAFWHVAAEMVQLHGGIGFTWEHEAHRYVKRAKSTQLLLGRRAEIYRSLGERAGLCTGNPERAAEGDKG